MDAFGSAREYASVHERRVIMFAAEAAVASACLAALAVCECLSLVSISVSLGFRWTNSDKTTVK